MRHQGCAMTCWVEIIILGFLEMWMNKVMLLLGCQSNSLAALWTSILLKSGCLQIDLKHCHYTHLPCRFSFKNHMGPCLYFYFSVALNKKCSLRSVMDVSVGRTSPDTGESTFTVRFPFLITHIPACVSPNSPTQKQRKSWRDSTAKWGWIPQRSLRWLQRITMHGHLLSSLRYTLVRKSKSGARVCMAVAQFIT